jgi:2-(1,2-epoxy-1,2-dihydrophenyl)acetyl-CoA isomerase
MNYAELVASEGDAVFVEVEHLGDKAIVTLADPDKRNVLSGPMMVQLLARVQELVADRDVKAIVLTGAGSGFSTGGDLRLMQGVVDSFGSEEDTEGAFSPYQFIRYQFGAMVRLIARSDKAFIAALNGPAAGVGLAFALTCDIALAAEDAVLVPAFGRLGRVPQVGTSGALSRARGSPRAVEL